ncbi:hypothetical protein HDV06_004025 [Boothiomyces sp. JEL0866]|nr:hypothetical protein HDV06_004025 [Boothiomyces sp. JEL0866]
MEIPASANNFQYCTGSNWDIYAQIFIVEGYCFDGYYKCTINGLEQYSDAVCSGKPTILNNFTISTVAHASATYTWVALTPSPMYTLGFSSALEIIANICLISTLLGYLGLTFYSIKKIHTYGIVYGPVIYFYTLSIYNHDQYQMALPTAGDLALAWILFFLLYTTIPVLIIRKVLHNQIKEEQSAVQPQLVSSKSEYEIIGRILIFQLLNFTLYCVLIAIKTKSQLLGSDRDFYALDVIPLFLILVHNLCLCLFEKTFKSLHQAILKPYRLDVSTYYEDLTYRSDKDTTRNTRLEIGSQVYNSVMQNERNHKRNEASQNDIPGLNFGDYLQNKLNHLSDNDSHEAESVKRKYQNKFLDISSSDNHSSQSQSISNNPGSDSNFNDLLNQKLHNLKNKETSQANSFGSDSHANFNDKLAQRLNLLATSSDYSNTLSQERSQFYEKGARSDLNSFVSHSPGQMSQYDGKNLNAGAISMESSVIVENKRGSWDKSSIAPKSGQRNSE